MKLDNGSVQDLYHYALAMQGSDESAFPCETLKNKLAACESAALILSNIEGDLENSFFDGVSPDADRFNSDRDLHIASEQLLNRVVEWRNSTGSRPDRQQQSNFLHSLWQASAATKYAVLSSLFRLRDWRKIFSQKSSPRLSNTVLIMPTPKTNLPCLLLFMGAAQTSTEGVSRVQIAQMGRASNQTQNESAMKFAFKSVDVRTPNGVESRAYWRKGGRSSQLRVGLYVPKTS